MQKEKTLLEQIREAKNLLLKLEDKKESKGRRLYSKHPLKIGDKIKVLTYIPFKKYELLDAIVTETGAYTWDGTKVKIEYIDKEGNLTGDYAYIFEDEYEFERI